MSKWIAEFELEDGDTMPEHMDLEYKGARIDFHCRLLEQEPTKNDLGVEYITKQAAIDCLDYTDGELPITKIKNLPSVTPPKPRKGKWISKPHVYGVTYCSECDFELKIDDTNYCPNCGAKMEKRTYEVEK